MTPAQTRKLGVRERAKLLKIFRRHRGEQSRLVRALGLSTTSLTHWFQGKITSARIQEAVLTRAAELIRFEEETKETANCFLDVLNA